MQRIKNIISELIIAPFIIKITILLLLFIYFELFANIYAINLSDSTFIELANSVILLNITLIIISAILEVIIKIISDRDTSIIPEILKKQISLIIVDSITILMIAYFIGLNLKISTFISTVTIQEIIVTILLLAIRQHFIIIIFERKIDHIEFEHIGTTRLNQASMKLAKKPIIQEDDEIISEDNFSSFLDFDLEDTEKEKSNQDDTSEEKDSDENNEKNMTDKIKEDDFDFPDLK